MTNNIEFEEQHNTLLKCVPMKARSLPCKSPGQPFLTSLPFLLLSVLQEGFPVCNDLCGRENAKRVLKIPTCCMSSRQSLPLRVGRTCEYDGISPPCLGD